MSVEPSTSNRPRIRSDSTGPCNRAKKLTNALPKATELAVCLVLMSSRFRALMRMSMLMREGSLKSMSPCMLSGSSL